MYRCSKANLIVYFYKMPKLLVHDIWYINVILGYQNVPSGPLCLYIHTNDISRSLAESIGFRLIESRNEYIYYWYCKANHIHDMREIVTKELLPFIYDLYIGSII
jgi:hypothetical protein